MERYKELKDMINTELKRIQSKGELTAASLAQVETLAHTLKCLSSVEKDEEKKEGGYSEGYYPERYPERSPNTILIPRCITKIAWLMPVDAAEMLGVTVAAVILPRADHPLTKVEDHRMRAEDRLMKMARAWNHRTETDNKNGALFTGVRHIEVKIMDLLLNLLIAAEAAYEMNPTANMEKWIDSLEDEITQKLSQNLEKPQK